MPDYGSGATDAPGLHRAENYWLRRMCMGESPAQIHRDHHDSPGLIWLAVVYNGRAEMIAEMRKVWAKR